MPTLDDLFRGVPRDRRSRALSLLGRAVRYGEARTVNDAERRVAELLAWLELATVSPVGERTLAVEPTDAGRALVREYGERRRVEHIAGLDLGYGSRRRVRVTGNPWAEE